MAVKRITVPFANTGEKTEIPLDVQANGSVSREKGFGEHYELPYDNPNAKDIERTIFNQIEFEQDSAIAEMQQHGVSVFSNENGYAYPKGALAFFNGAIYQSLKDSNADLPTSASWSIVKNDADTVKSSITKGYDPAFQYEPGDIVKINGIYYECYNQNGCKGIDPTDPKNRPSGWTNPDPDAPYYWVKIGKFLMLPEIGSPIYLMNNTPREGLIKLRNDGQLSATKFWRIAELNPNLVSNGLITLADMRANVIRALDDGKGIDVGRVINSYQEDATQLLTGNPGISLGAVRGGAFKAGDVYTYIESSGNTNGFYRSTFSNSNQIRTATEERVKNIAMLACIRI